MTFHEKLVKLRKLKGLTQDEFASAVGVSRQAVYKWESGQSYPEVTKLLEIKMIFDISIDDLLDESYEVILPDKPKKRRGPKPAARPDAHEPMVLPLIHEEQPVYDGVNESVKTDEKTVTPAIAESVETVETVVEKAPAMTADAAEEEQVSAPAEGEDKVEEPVEATVAATVSSPAPAEPVTAPEAPIPSAEGTPVVKNEQAEEPAERKRGFLQRLFGRK